MTIMQKPVLNQKNIDLDNSLKKQDSSNVPFNRLAVRP